MRFLLGFSLSCYISIFTVLMIEPMETVRVAVVSDTNGKMWFDIVQIIGGLTATRTLVLSWSR